MAAAALAAAIALRCPAAPHRQSPYVGAVSADFETRKILFSDIFSPTFIPTQLGSQR